MSGNRNTSAAVSSKKTCESEWAGRIAVPDDPSMSVRRAGAEDLDRCVELGAAFHAYSPHRSIPLDAVALREFLAGLSEHGALFVSSAGMIGGVLSPLYFNPTYVVAAELFWWAPEGGGRELREAFEAWAAAEGATAVQFCRLDDEHAPRLDALYRRAGYRAIETSYLKEIG